MLLSVAPSVPKLIAEQCPRLLDNNNSNDSNSRTMELGAKSSGIRCTRKVTRKTRSIRISDQTFIRLFVYMKDIKESRREQTDNERSMMATRAHAPRFDFLALERQTLA